MKPQVSIELYGRNGRVVARLFQYEGRWHLTAFDSVSELNCLDVHAAIMIAVDLEIKHRLN